MNINFHLRNLTEKTPQRIWAVFFYEGKRIKIDTQKSISPLDWSLSNQKALSSYKSHLELNKFLKSVKDFIVDYVEKSTKRIYKDDIQNAVNREFEIGKVRREEGEITDLISFIDFHIETKGDKAKGTVTTLVQTKKNIIMAFGLVSEKAIKQYEKLNLRERGGSELLIPTKQIVWNEVNFFFMERFKAFLLKTTYAIKKDGKTILLKYKKNYIAKQIKVLKQFLNSAVQYGYLKDLAFKNIKCEWEEADNVYTDWAEIEQLKLLQLTPDSVEEKVRNLYVFNCYLGLRFSDLIKRRQGDFISNNNEVFIKLRTTKTDELLRFPVLPAAQSILLKYDYNLPYVDENTFNETIKIVCMKAGITREESVRETRGGVKTFFVRKKYEMISSHTGRRSFATNFDADNVPLKEIMAVTGHTTEKALRTYIKKKEETAFLGFKAVGERR